MLDVEDRFVIKDMFRQGVSVSEIARRTGHDRKTVRNAINTPLLAPKPPRTPRRCKIDPFIPYLQKRVAIGVLNAHKLYTEIIAQGYPGRETQVRDWVAQQRQPKPTAATVRFETQPGEQAQVDWAHFGLINTAGTSQRLYAFLMTLGWSRTLFVEFTTAMDATRWLRCHQHAFAYFGGVPRKMLHDNLKTAVVDRGADGKPHWNKLYLDFANHYGFSPQACAPYRAQTKGKVENAVAYVRGNFWTGLEFSDLADLNRKALVWLNDVANKRVHGTTHQVPFDRLAAEGLQRLRIPPYDTSVTTSRRSSRDCLISYGGNLYSVPASYAAQQLTIKITEAGDLIVLDVTGSEVARHKLSSGKNQRVMVQEHYQGLIGPSKQLAVVGAIQITAQLSDLRLSAPQVETRSLAIYEQLLELS